MKDFSRYAIGVVLLVLAIVLIVVGFNFIRNIFNGDDSQQQTVKKVDLLTVPQKDQTVQYTIDGQIVGSEEHRIIRIKIDRDFRTIEVVQGYGNNIIKSQETPNTLEAYEAFIAAINGEGFVASVPPEGRGEEAESCPLGRRFIYEVAPGTSDSFRTWSNSCGRKEGTFAGDASAIRTLFQRQIPDYDKYVSDVRLS